MEVLELLSRRARNPTEKVGLQKLATDYNAYNIWRQGWPGIIDLFQQFPSIQVDSADLASRLPLLQPRFYSIASSYDYLQKGDQKGSTFFDLLANVAEYDGPDGSTRQGFCSSFLNDLNVGDKISCYLRPADNFRLPSDLCSNTPLICVAAGTGIAPFRSFWQQKQFELEMHNTINPIHLFFGCRDKSTDYFREETDPLEGKILIRRSAFSRVDDIPKEYVQVYT
jgi:sulfite reductase alpha subunit-like flavoprotein